MVKVLYDTTHPHHPDSKKCDAKFQNVQERSQLDGKPMAHIKNNAKSQPVRLHFLSPLNLKLNRSSTTLVPPSVGIGSGPGLDGERDGDFLVPRGRVLGCGEALFPP